MHTVVSIPSVCCQRHAYMNYWPSREAKTTHWVKHLTERAPEFGLSGVIYPFHPFFALAVYWTGHRVLTVVSNTIPSVRCLRPAHNYWALDQLNSSKVIVPFKMLITDLKKIKSCLSWPLYILVRGVVFYSANFRPHFTTANTQYLFIFFLDHHGPMSTDVFVL